MRIRQTKPKGVTTQRKALDEYILMALFVILLKRVNLLLLLLLLVVVVVAVVVLHFS